MYSTSLMVLKVDTKNSLLICLILHPRMRNLRTSREEKKTPKQYFRSHTTNKYNMLLEQLSLLMEQQSSEEQLSVGNGKEKKNLSFIQPLGSEVHSGSNSVDNPFECIYQPPVFQILLTCGLCEPCRRHR